MADNKNPAQEQQFDAFSAAAKECCYFWPNGSDSFIGCTPTNNMSGSLTVYVFYPKNKQVLGPMKYEKQR